MRREIRCRAWDKIEKKMWFPIIRPDGRLMAENQLGGYVTYDDPQDPLMQYTGLKNVFESDIIRDHVGIGLVEYVDDKAAFRINYKNGRAKWFIDYNLKGELESIEVIGNIHASPELLEEKE